jgi:hypothetical protein
MVGKLQIKVGCVLPCHVNMILYLFWCHVMVSLMVQFLVLANHVVVLFGMLLFVSRLIRLVIIKTC